MKKYEIYRSWLEENWAQLKSLGDSGIIKKLENQVENQFRNQSEKHDFPDKTTLKRWIQRLRSQDEVAKGGEAARENVGEAVMSDAAGVLAANQLEYLARIREFVGDIVTMDWNVDELRLRGVPKGEVKGLLNAYEAHWQRLVPDLKNDKYHLPPLGLAPLWQVQGAVVTPESCTPLSDLPVVPPQEPDWRV